MIKNITIGQCINCLPLRLSKLMNRRENGTGVVFSDRTGTLNAFVPASVLDDNTLSEGTVYSVSGAVVVENMQPFLRVKSMNPTTDYSAVDLYGGLDEKKVAELVANIRALERKITHEGYRTLVEVCLSDSNLKKMAELPATHNRYGVYAGGALVSTVGVSYMVISAMASYVNKGGNGFSTKPPQWNVLVTAALLHAFGRIDFSSEDDPFQKSIKGLNMNYFPTLQHAIEKVVFYHKIPISEEDLSRLFNILSVGVSKTTDTRAVTKDGYILRSVINLYAQCDMIDNQYASHGRETDERGYFYSRKLHHYLLEEGDE